MNLLTSFILFFIAFIGWSLALGLIYFIIYLKRENTSLKRALLDKYATKQSTDLKDRLVEQMKIAHNRMQEVPNYGNDDDEEQHLNNSVNDDINTDINKVNDELQAVRNEILQAQALINQALNPQGEQKNKITYVDEKTFEQTLESYNFKETKAFKIKH